MACGCVFDFVCSSLMECGIESVKLTMGDDGHGFEQAVG